MRLLDDLQLIPFMVKADLRDAYLRAVAVPLEQLIRVHASSGTGGKATVVA